jgi:hypothetical protein
VIRPYCKERLVTVDFSEEVTTYKTQKQVKEQKKFCVLKSINFFNSDHFLKVRFIFG